MSISVSSINTSSNPNTQKVLSKIEKLHKHIDKLHFITNNKVEAFHKIEFFQEYDIASDQIPNIVGITKNFQNNVRKCSPPYSFQGNTEAGVRMTYNQPSISRRRFIEDKRSNISFLIDTCSDTFLISAILLEKKTNAYLDICR
ncbi:hypothetical protein CDAR_44491 [Caerostris darwini]|uniref:Uncharacterized protein n=1 Tax=Caerostris darwini TaxID=1538125 RepID=A0AAV4QJX2_9ARAC|nr:hypothetical protein CDAR_44491 [Caerostris darwini]